MLNDLIKFSIVLPCILWLSACATTKSIAPKERLQYQQAAVAIKQWNLFGRIAVSTPEESFTANIAWIKSQSGQTINIYNSLGNSYLKLKQDDNIEFEKVTLELRDGKIIKGRSIEDAMAQVVSWQIPIHLLDFWVRGLTVSDNKTSQILYNSDGSISTQTYFDWHVEYPRYANYNGLRLPKRLKLEHHDLSLKLSIRKWFK
jgi:outer membrane lipoprotein LolB